LDREPSHANPYQRYALAAPAFLADAEDRRYVRIAPAGDGFLVDHGTLVHNRVGMRPTMTPVAPPDRFGGDDIAAAVQRVCALAAGWLGFDEWEVEQTRRLFLAEPNAAEPKT